MYYLLAWIFLKFFPSFRIIWNNNTRRCPFLFLVSWHGRNRFKTLFIISLVFILDGQSSVKLHFQNGETKDVDVALVTSSLGFLKHNSPTLFQPSLPDDKLRSMQKLGFGVVNKVQLQYNQPFWESDWKGIRLLWDCDSVDRLEGDWSIKVRVYAKRIALSLFFPLQSLII